ncbi:AimR family lysis-lysogeny pheromone receptor [Priestia flexa]|uniref:AimR family lysis-lysogeny pheromone receptor n=1 Tax=Priestia flexa TaxID=86664 RepID=UPI003CFD8BB7
MKKIMLKLSEDAKKKEITNTEIAKRIGVVPSMIGSYFSLEYQISFLRFVELTKVVYGTYNFELILQFCKAFNKKIEVEMLEWAYSNGAVTILKHLLSKECVDNNLTELYELLLKRIIGEISHQDFYTAVENFKFFYTKDDCIVRVAIESCTLHALMDLSAYNVTNHMSDIVLKKAENINNSYIKEAYIARIKTLSTVSYFKNNQVEKAKLLANSVVNEDMKNKFPLYYNNALLHLSEIYSLTDYKKSISYIRRALHMLEEGYFNDYKHRERVLQDTHDFISIHHDKYRDLFLKSEAELAHKYARSEDFEYRIEALKILADLERRNGKLTSFQMYYRALALNDRESMREAEASFYITGDIYYSQLPKLWLKSDEK